MPDWKALRIALLAENSDSVLPPSVQLPVLPQALNEFQQAAQDPDADTGELARIIASDAGLSTELLRNVNSCATGVQAPVTSVRQALVMLGTSATLLHLTASGMREAMRSTASRLINFQNFWNTNLERSLLAREVARGLGADPDVAFTAGMLQDFLLPLITNQMTTEYLEFMENRDRYENLISFEQQKFGWDHALAAAQVMHAWQFPDALVCCVCCHHRGLAILDDPDLANSSAAAVAISSLMPDALRQEATGLATLISLDQAWESLDFADIARRIEVEFQQVTGESHRFSFRRAYENAVQRINA